MSTLKPQGIEPVGLPKPKGDLSGLENFTESSFYDEFVNPDGYQIINSELRGETNKLFRAISVEESGFDVNYSRITGGDRHIVNGKSVSLPSAKYPNGERVGGLNSLHLRENGASAVDLRLRLNNGSNLSFDRVNDIISKYNIRLEYNLKRLPSFYNDGHHHLRLIR